MSLSLKQLQENFQAYMLEQDNSVVNEVLDTQQVPATTRLNIYRDAYSLRLLSILAIDYPFLKQFMGERFADLGREYINHFPSDSFSIRIFGRNLLKFLTNNSDYAPIFAEFTKFEWNLASLRDAADGDYLTLEDMAKISPEMWGAMKLTFHPSGHLESFESNVAEIWTALNENKTLPTTELQTEKKYFIFWRFNFEPRFMPITEQQVVMFKKINENKVFGEICEELCEYIPEEEVIQFAGGTLRDWIAAGIFCRVD